LRRTGFPTRRKRLGFQPEDHMKVDLHFHAVLSKRIGFVPVFFLQVIQQAQQVGLDALAMTNHFDTPGFADIYAYLDREYAYSGHAYEVGSVKLLPGIEVSVREGPHLLALGGREAILEYQRRFRHSKMPETYCSARDFFDRQEGLPLLTICAHPFRPRREITRIDDSLYPRFDALELNARDLVLLGRDIVVRTEGFAQEYHLPVVGGSDAHHYHQLGSVYSRFDLTLDTVAELQRAIQQAQYTIHIDDLLEKRVAAARRAKEAIKQARLGSSGERRHL
jgi:PHP family Zn ribbon phosphoesterase